MNIDAYMNEGQVPIIRAPKGNAAEMIAKKLETSIRDAILTASRANGPSLFSQDSAGLSNLSRPRTSTLRIILLLFSILTGNYSPPSSRQEHRSRTYGLTRVDVSSTCL